MATWPSITDDDGTNTTGTVVNNTNVWTPIQSYIGGAWSSVAFNAANFTGNGSMTWTVASGDQSTYAYVEIGKTMIVSFDILTTTVGGTPNPLLMIAIPNGRTAQKNINTSFHYSDNGSVGTGLASVSAGGTTINHVWLHLGVPALPFGGVGESGMGAYHGRHSFEAFSHRKAVLDKRTFIDPNFLYPPYGKVAKAIFRKVL